MTHYNPNLHHRHSIRLRYYDYSKVGAYFVTICTKERECLFGEIRAENMILNQAGEMIQSSWRGLAQHYPGVQVDEFIVMPNHIRGIIAIENHVITNSNVGARFIAPRIKGDRNDMRHSQKGVINYAPTLGQIIRYFKGKTSFVLKKQMPSFQWQRNYYEHIIRNEDEINRVRRYIGDNPAQWALDDENPNRLGEPTT